MAATVTSNKPGLVGLGAFVALVGGYQYGQKRLRSEQATFLDKQKKKETAALEAQSKVVHDLEEKVNKLQAENDTLKGIVKPVATAPAKAASSSEEGWLSEWMDASKEIEKAGAKKH